jgi:hypothetical protein
MSASARTSCAGHRSCSHAVDLEAGDFARRDELEHYHHGELERVAFASDRLYPQDDQAEPRHPRACQVKHG